MPYNEAAGLCFGHIKQYCIRVIYEPGIDTVITAYPINQNERPASYSSDLHKRGAFKGRPKTSSVQEDAESEDEDNVDREDGDSETDEEEDDHDV